MDVRGVFRTLSNTEDGGSCKYLMTFSCSLFSQEAPSRRYMTCARAHKLNFCRPNSVCPDSIMKTWLQKVLNFYNLICFAREGTLISKVKMQNHFVIIFCGIWFALSGYYWQDLEKTSYMIHWMSSAF